MFYAGVLQSIVIYTLAGFCCYVVLLLHISWCKCGKVSVRYIPNSRFLRISKLASNNKLSEVVILYHSTSLRTVKIVDYFGNG